MKTATLNETKYAELLRGARPVVIRTKAEHRRLLAAAAALIETPESDLTDEEGRLLELLTMLIEEYEDRTDPLPQVSPGEMLAGLLEQREMKPADLADILPKSRVSEILGGSRDISKSQAKALAARFRVPADVFL